MGTPGETLGLGTRESLGLGTPVRPGVGHSSSFGVGQFRESLLSVIGQSRESLGVDWARRRVPGEEKS